MCCATTRSAARSGGFAVCHDPALASRIITLREHKMLLGLPETDKTRLTAS